MLKDARLAPFISALPAGRPAVTVLRRCPAAWSSREQLTAALEGRIAAARLSDELFSVADLLDREHGLRRNLSDPARPAAQNQVVRVLLEGKISDAALETVAAAVSARWARPGDLADTLERLGVVAASAEAEAQARLDDVEDELFRFGRIAAANLELSALTARRSPSRPSGSS